MGFLKKHYEKILLAVLLTGFIGLLAFQLVLWRQNEQIQVEKLKGFKDPPPNYQPVKFDDEKSPFRVLNQMSSQLIFKKSEPRETAVGPDGSPAQFTDFMLPYPMAVCPYCNRVVPANMFPAGDGEGKCPFRDCGKTLRAPYNLAQAKDLDSDEDGIPDKDEIQMGLNSKDGSDAGIDSDGDGFSNFEEFICKTDCKNPKSRPRYHEKMYLRSINRNRLLFKVLKITFDDQRKNAKLNIEVERPRMRQRFKTFLGWEKGKIFPTFTKDEYRNKTPFYQIVNITPKFTKRGESEIDESFVTVRKCRIYTKYPEKATSADIPVPTEASEVDAKNKVRKFYYQLEGDEITAIARSEVYEPKVKAVIGINLVNDLKESEYYLNSIISVGDKYKTGQDLYRITEINQEKNTVKVKYQGEAKAFVGQEFVIGNISILQQKLEAHEKGRRPRGKRRAKKKNE